VPEQRVLVADLRLPAEEAAVEGGRDLVLPEVDPAGDAVLEPVSFAHAAHDVVGFSN
jgi:hypothetical protein